MILFLTSSPCNDDVPEGIHIPCILNEVNDFVRHLTESWKPMSRFLIISANPTNAKLNDEMADTFEKAFVYHGLTISDMTVCDERNEERLPELLVASDVVMLAGGHVPTQNAFFERLGLRERMQDYPGIVIGVSAGSMNSADVVYAQPEMPGESLNPRYQRWLKGLGLTDLMILPHYQETKGYILDGRWLYEDITYTDSKGKKFYAIVDGSYVLVKDGQTMLYGEAYLIQDGRLKQICRVGEHLAL